MFNTSFFNVKSIAMIALFSIVAYWIFKHFSKSGE